uniref:TGB3 n=1 Tax=Garlic virus D TaxID=12430 RepID=A0A6M2YWT0_9VIRU|nr:TGB3 [Garlic virus D]
MVIVTTFHIDRARELIITNTNNCRDAVLNQFGALSAELQTTATNVNNFRSAATASLQHILDRLHSNTSRPSASHSQTDANSSPDFGGDSAGNFRRTFFSNAGLALDATRTLLGYVPPARYDVPTTTLPLDELFGQLHALHQNSLEWLTHISHNVDSILDMLNPNNLLSQGTPLSRLREALVALTRQVNDIHLTLHASSSNPDQPEPQRPHTRLEAIEASLEQLHIKIDEFTAVLPHISDQSQVEPKPGTPSPPDNACKLPDYQAQHPTRACRTYGTILFDDTSSRIPMDIVGRPASTALKLEVHITPTDQVTKVSYKIYDDGYLLQSDHIETPHKLQHHLSDGLALLHQKCPNFIYKIKGHGLC